MKAREDWYPTVVLVFVIVMAGLVVLAQSCVGGVIG